MRKTMHKAVFFLYFCINILQKMRFWYSLANNLANKITVLPLYFKELLNEKSYVHKKKVSTSQEIDTF